MDRVPILPFPPDRATGRRGPSRTPESKDNDELTVKERIRMSQGGRRNAYHAATWPQAKRAVKPGLEKRQPLGRMFSNIDQRRTIPGDSKHDISSTRSGTKISSRQPAKPVDQVSLPLSSIRSRSALNRSAATGSSRPVHNLQKMNPSSGSKYEPTEIIGQVTAIQAAISTPPPKVPEASISNPKALLADHAPGATFTTLSRNDEVQLYSLLQRIRRLREMIWALRSRVQEQRGILRSKQYDKAAADDKYMRLSRLQESKSDQGGPSLTSEGQSLRELFQACEQARAEYGPLEDDCNSLEDQLGSQEYELTRLEEKFVRVCNLAIPPDIQAPSPSVNPESRSDSSDSEVFQTYHPLVAEYLSKMGDVDILIERLERHRDEKAGLEADRKTRRVVKLSLAPEDEEWLEQSGKIENDILKELHEAEAEAEELRRRCLAKGLLDENGEPKDFQTQEQEAFIEDVDVDAKGQKSDYLKFPILLPQPRGKDLPFKASAPKPDEQSEGAGDHINQWLLHNLRSSPLDVNLLVRTFEAEVGQIEEQKWESDVLQYWYKDGAIKDASGYRVSSAARTSPLRDETKHSTGSLAEHKFEPVLGITGRKAAVSDTSSISGSEFLGRDDENEMVVGPLPRSKYTGNGL